VLKMRAYDQHLCTAVCRCYLWVRAVLMVCAYEQHTRPCVVDVCESMLCL